MYSCQKEKKETTTNVGTEIRTLETFFFDHSTLAIDDCCARVFVRTNHSDPIHTVLITKSGSPETTVGQHIHGGLYGGTWHYDSNYPNTPHYWIMEFCFEEPGDYCFNLLLTGVDGPGEPDPGVPDPNDPHKICFEIEECEGDPVEDCIQYICWEMLAGCCDLDVVESITLEISQGNFVTIPIGPYNVAGNYYAMVAEILTVLNGYSWGGNFHSYNNCKKCLKAEDENSEVPGFFFVNSNIRIVSINGKKDCAVPPSIPNWQPESKPIFDGCPDGNDPCFSF